MGCGVSTLSRDINNLGPIAAYSGLSRQTRIIQEEEVDVFIDDEYDVIDTDWKLWSSNAKEIEVYGEWKLGETAGGSRNDLELFATNPQYLLSVGPPEKYPKKEDYYKVPKKRDTIELTLCLTQLGKTLLHVAFFIYKADETNERLSAEYFLCVPPEGEVGAFVNWRQLRHQFHLTPGHYVIVPAVFKPHIEGKFKLTVYSFPPLSLKPI